MDLLDRLLQHDAWTTARLLNCAAQLRDASLDQRFELGHSTIRSTFIHMIGNTRSWTEQMAGIEKLSPPIASDVTIAELAKQHELVSQDLYRLGRDVVDSGLLDETFIDAHDTPPRCKSLGAGILHLATHSMHHRAQLLFMLRQLGVEDLPEGDALSWEKQHIGGWQPA